MREISDRVREYVVFMCRAAENPLCDGPDTADLLMHAREGFSDEENHDAAMLHALRQMARPDAREWLERIAGPGAFEAGLAEQRQYWGATDDELQSLLASVSP